MQVVFDSSTLILLAKISLLRTVSENFGCLVTREVEKESTENKNSFDAKLIAQLIKEGKIGIVKNAKEGGLEKDFRLGKGEASALSFAIEKGMVVATDDKPAIKACRVFNVGFVTAMDFVIDAFDNGKISAGEAKAKIKSLDEYGRYDTRIISEALEKIGDEK